MPQQLVYTSAPRLLDAGRTGYGTVARTPALGGNLITTLERASQFARLQGMRSDRVIFLFLPLPGGGGSIARIADAGADHTGRTNHCAHHVVFSPSEIQQISSAGVGPADVALTLASIGRWRTQWADPPGLMDEHSLPLGLFFKPTTSLPARSWEQYARSPARAALLPGNEPRRAILYPDAWQTSPTGEPMLRLFAEAGLLTPLAQTWTIGWTTDFQPNDELSAYPWAACPASSPQAQRLRTSGRPLVDLTNPDRLSIPQGQQAELATNGPRASVPAIAQPAPSPIPTGSRPATSAQQPTTPAPERDAPSPSKSTKLVQAEPPRRVSITLPPGSTTRKASKVKNRVPLVAGVVVLLLATAIALIVKHNKDKKEQITSLSDAIDKMLDNPYLADGGKKIRFDPKLEEKIAELENLDSGQAGTRRQLYEKLKLATEGQKVTLEVQDLAGNYPNLKSIIPWKADSILPGDKNFTTWWYFQVVRPLESSGINPEDLQAGIDAINKEGVTEAEKPILQRLERLLRPAEVAEATPSTTQSKNQTPASKLLDLTFEEVFPKDQTRDNLAFNLMEQIEAKTIKSQQISSKLKSILGNRGIVQFFEDKPTSSNFTINATELLNDTIWPEDGDMIYKQCLEYLKLEKWEDSKNKAVKELLASKEYQAKLGWPVDLLALRALSTEGLLSVEEKAVIQTWISQRLGDHAFEDHPIVVKALKIITLPPSNTAQPAPSTQDKSLVDVLLAHKDHEILWMNVKDDKVDVRLPKPISKNPNQKITIEGKKAATLIPNNLFDRWKSEQPLAAGTKLSANLEENFQDIKSDWLLLQHYENSEIISRLLVCSKDTLKNSLVTMNKDNLEKLNSKTPKSVEQVEFYFPVIKPLSRQAENAAWKGSEELSICLDASSLEKSIAPSSPLIREAHSSLIKRFPPYSYNDPKLMRKWYHDRVLSIELPLEKEKMPLSEQTSLRETIALEVLKAWNRRYWELKQKDLDLKSPGTKTSDKDTAGQSTQPVTPSTGNGGKEALKDLEDMKHRSSELIKKLNSEKDKDEQRIRQLEEFITDLEKPKLALKTIGFLVGDKEPEVKIPEAPTIQAFVETKFMDEFKQTKEAKKAAEDAPYTREGIQSGKWTYSLSLRHEE